MGWQDKEIALAKAASSSGNALTPEQEATLSHFIYNPVEDKLEADVPIETTISSLFLGGQHVMSSGGENVFFTELSRNTSYLPCFTGIKDQAIPQNQTFDGIVQPFARKYSDDMFDIPLAGPESNPIVYGPSEFTGTLTSNLSSYGFEFRPQDTLPVGTKLTFSVNRDDENGILIYKQELIIDVEHTGGNLLTWWFDHPLEGFVGDTFLFMTKVTFSGQAEEIIKASLVEGSSNVWSISALRTFDDRTLTTEDSIIPVYKNANSTDFSISDYQTIAADASSGEFTLTVEVDRVSAFYVFDYSGNWNGGSRKITVSLSNGDNYVLTRRDRIYFFYKDESDNWQWYYESRRVG